MKRLLNRLIGDERGGAIAEFMLGLIPLVIAFALVFEFGRAFWSHQAAIKGVRDATRYLTRVEDPNDPGAQAVAQNLLLTGQQAPGGTAR
jgi:Flp pilus assembly protein TadG